MFWCHNCQQPIQSVQQIRCELCSCEAIEQIESNNNPQNFQPYVPPQNNQQSSQNIQNSQQNSQISYGSMRDPLGMHLFERMGGMEGFSMMSTILQRLGDEENPVYIRYTVSRPIFGILMIDNEDNGKNPVSEEKFNKLPKVQIQQQCAICQEKQGNGLILPCKHEFHENCIKPWFQQKNTCPCCRTQV